VWRDDDELAVLLPIMEAKRKALGGTSLLRLLLLGTAALPK
jgi:hypothetical protein